MDVDPRVSRGRLAGLRAVSVSVPDLRDYHLINAEVGALLDAGHRHVLLVGAENQRLLLSGLRGDWDAYLEVEGRVGPEFCAGLDAPGLTIVCRGSAADGFGSVMKNGLVAVLGDVGAGAGYGLRGGTLVASGEVGPRAGLNQSGGAILITGAVGPLAGERQSGGLLLLPADRTGPYLGRGRTGGELVAYDSDRVPEAIPGTGRRSLQAVLAPLRLSRLRVELPWPLSTGEGSPED